MEDFKGFGFKKNILEVLDSLKFKVPTDVQKKVIPLAMSGKDVVFTARTGSGKTLAFLLGYISKINLKQGVQMLILVPTRELCMQVAKEAERLCEPLGIKVGNLYGGRPIEGDYRTTSRKNHVMIGTPGRLMEHINSKALRVGEVKYLVYDESDQMLDRGFFPDCVYIRKRVSVDAQVIFSSATITKKVEEFLERVIDDYELIQVGEMVPKSILQEMVRCDIPDKDDLLVAFFKAKRFKRAMVFCNTKVKSDRLARLLNKNGLDAKEINSDLKQGERESLIDAFKKGKIRILVATDLASRGLHIERVDTIVNFDVPTKDEFYIHRIGRSGRTGRGGYAFTIVCPEDEERFDNIMFDYKLDICEVDKEFNRKENRGNYFDSVDED